MRRGSEFGTRFGSAEITGWLLKRWARRATSNRVRLGLGAALLTAVGASAGASAATIAAAKPVHKTGAACRGAPGEKPLYLTFDTGHMGVAPLVSEVLRRQGVPASFFLANEKTLNGGSSLDDQWSPWWRELAAAGHAFGSHTWDHWVWQADRTLPDGSQGFRIRPTAGADAGKSMVVSAAALCEQLRRPAARFEAVTGQKLGGVFRAPAGRTSPALLDAARRCGFDHVPWSAAGFLGDELPSEKYSNPWLLNRALRTIAPGDILLAHLGIWSRKDPWAPAVLEPLIEGLRHRGFCFSTLREHPQYRHAWR